MRKKTLILLISLCVLGTTMAMGQPYPGDPFTRGYSWEVSAKAMSLGGAFTGVSDDYSALYYNPAGLGQLKKASVVGGFSHLMLEDQVTFSGFMETDNASFSKLNNIGVVLPVPTYQGSLVLSFGYHRIRGFGRAMILSETEQSADYEVVFDSISHTIPFDVSHGGQALEEGSLSQTSLGASIELAPNIYVGGSLNFWGGVRDYSWDRYILGDVYPTQNPEDGLTYDVLIADTYYSTQYQVQYSGVNMTLGVFLKPVSLFQMGIVVKTPVTLRCKRTTDIYIYEEVPPGWEDVRLPDYSDNWPITSKIQSPWVFQIGSAFNLGPLMITGDADLTDYSQIRYKTDTPEGFGQGQANNDMRQNLGSTFNYRFGGQLTAPFAPVCLRGGYGFQMSPQKDAPSSHHRKTISFGAGIRFSPQLVFDVGYAVTSWEYGPDYLVDDWGYARTSWEDIINDPVGREDIRIQKIMATLTYEM